MTTEEKRIWKRYEDAEKKMKQLRKQLKQIRENSSLNGDQKREKADKIFAKQIQIAEWVKKKK